MALFDGTISLQTTIETAWQAAQQTLTPAEKIVTTTPNAAFAAMDSVLGYLYIFRVRSNGEVAVRVLIDEAPRVREVFRTYKGNEALDMLATLGSADQVFMERIQQLGKARLQHIEELVGNPLGLLGLPPPNTPSQVPTVPAESLIQQPAPDWLTGLSSAVQPEGRAVVPKVVSSPYAEPIVADKRQLWWVVGIISAVFLLGLGVLITLVAQSSRARSYDSQWFSLTVPTGWSIMQPNARTQLCTSNTGCPLVIGKDPFRFVAVYFIIETVSPPQTIQSIESNYWYGLQAQHPQSNFLNQRTEQINGRSVVIIDYQVPNAPDTFQLARHIILLNPTTLLHVVGYAVSASNYEESRQEINQILQTVTIKS
jgi:hypothetical protein